jgi:transmembrane 9 superfamily protein 2/4
MWRSFLSSGMAGVYVFLYSIFYFLTQLEIVKFTSALIYFTYMLMLSFAVFTFTGTVGFLSCFAFTRYLFSCIKID